VVGESSSEGNAGGFATKDDTRFCHLNSFSLYLSIYLSLWRWSAAWWSGGLLTNDREKGGGGEWLPIAAVMEV
jgi:hypothetical protein